MKAEDMEGFQREIERQVIVAVRRHLRRKGPDLDLQTLARLSWALGISLEIRPKQAAPKRKSK